MLSASVMPASALSDLATASASSSARHASSSRVAACLPVASSFLDFSRHTSLSLPSFPFVTVLYERTPMYPRPSRSRRCEEEYSISGPRFSFTPCRKICRKIAAKLLGNILHPCPSCLNSAC